MFCVLFLPRKLVRNRKLPNASVPLLGAGLTIFILVLMTGCGGAGAGGNPPPPPPPAGDFQIRVTPSVSVQQGGIGAGLGVSVDALNGFNSPVTISVEGIPFGVGVSPVDPVTISPNQSRSLTLTASVSAVVGTSPITIRGSSGALSHAAISSLTITPKAPFHIALSPASANLTRGNSTSSQVQLVVDSGRVTQVLLSVVNPLPSQGVSWYVSTGGVLTLGHPATLSIQTFALGESLTFPIVFTAQQGADSSVTAFLLTVTAPFPHSSAPTRTTFVRTDEGVNDIVYDPIRKLVFATVHNLNKVEVFSSQDGHRVATIPVIRPLGIDIDPDGRHIYVGTATGIISVIDAQLLQVVERDFIQDSWGPFPGNSRPPRAEHVKAMADGSVFVLERDGSTSGQELFKWDPATGTFADRTPTSLRLLTQAMWRSRDGTKLLIGWWHSAGGVIALYNTATDSFTPPVDVPGVGSAGPVAFHPDGTKVAVLNGAQIILFDDRLNELKRVSTAAPYPSPGQGILYSRDGRFLYLGQATLTVFDGQDLSLVGVLPSIKGEFNPALPIDVDETGMIFAATERGIAFVDGTSPRVLSAQAPAMRLPNALDPPQGDVSFPAQTTVNGVGFVSGAQVFFGAPPASPQPTPGTNVTVISTNIIQVTPPPATAPSAATVTVVHPDGWYALAPEGYAYGPQVLFVQPNTGPPEGGSSVVIFGYGFAYPASQIQVTVGGQPATVTNVFPFAGISPFFFPMHNITIRTPAGVPGLADLTITTPSGTITVPRGFTYLRRAKVVGVSGRVAQVIFDQRRNRLYATNSPANRVEVFDLVTEQFLAPISVGAVPAGLALIPDGSRLVVANFRDNTVSVIDPDNPASAATFRTDADPGCGPLPTLVVGGKPHHAVIQIGCGNLAGGGVLRVVDAATLTFSCAGIPGCNLVPSNFSAGTDIAATPTGNKVYAGDGSNDGGDVAVWDLDAGTFLHKTTGVGILDAAVSADDNFFVTNFAILGPDLRARSTPQEPRFLRVAAASLNNLFGRKLHPSGSLLYVPQTTGVDIFDVRRGRVVSRIVTPEHITGSIDALALDQTGRRIFLASQSGLTIVELSVVPLSIGSVTPERGPTGGGTAVTIRGSGFQAGSVVKFADIAVTATYVDEDTLRVASPALPAGAVRVTVVNPDGRQYSVDAGFIYAY